MLAVATAPASVDVTLAVGGFGESIQVSAEGRSSLDDLMRSLLAEHAQPLLAERIFAAAQRFVDANAVRELRSFAVDAAPVPVANVLGRCVPLTPKQIWTFSLGVSIRELSSGTVLRDVEPDSAAYQAGLRDGQVLLAWSFWYGDPDREVTLSVRAPGEGGAPLRIHYLPRGRQVTILQGEVVAGCVDGLAGGERAAANP